MSETLNNRIKFNRKGTQRKFITEARAILGLSWEELAKKLKISRHTLADWTREKITISEVGIKMISRLTRKPIPAGYKIIDPRIRLRRAGNIGGRSKFKKYGNIGGDETYRKRRWQEWWKSVGQYKKPALGLKTLLQIKIPKKSKLLAEFIGILLGDGNISTYHVGITLSSNEKQYIAYVQKIIVKLFGVMPAIFKHKRSQAVTIVVNRKMLSDFCQKFGFEIGNKVQHQVDIPKWIKENKVFSQECVRGLMDTDGCFFTHSYSVGGKRYSYTKITLTNASFPIISSVRKILINSGFSVRISKNGKDVRIESGPSVLKYIREIGTHNNKHLKGIRDGRLRRMVRQRFAKP